MFSINEKHDVLSIFDVKIQLRTGVRSVYIACSFVDGRQ